MRPRSGLRNRLSRAGPKGALGAEPFLNDIAEVEAVRAGPGDGDEVDSVGQKPGIRAEALAAEALDAVALDGPPELARHDDAEARRDDEPLGLRRHEQREVARGHTKPLGLHPREVGALAEPPFAAERERQTAYFL
jgi:hypothetical protein